MELHCQRGQQRCKATGEVNIEANDANSIKLWLSLCGHFLFNDSDVFVVPNF
jgi:hypothetical protein